MHTEMGTVLYAAACVVVPAVWALVAVAIFRWWERRKK
jgi:hypothetical protein